MSQPPQLAAAGWLPAVLYLTLPYRTHSLTDCLHSWKNIKERTTMTVMYSVIHGETYHQKPKLLYKCTIHSNQPKQHAVVEIHNYG